MSDADEMVPFSAMMTSIDSAADFAAEEVAARLVTAAPPNAIDAERALLGGILLQASALDLAVDEGLTAGDFYRPAHGRVYAAMLRLSEQAEPVDVLTVCRALEASGELEGAGGRTGVAELRGLIPTAAHVGAYARHIRDAATRRRLIDAGTAIVREAQRGGKVTTEIVDEAERAILAVGQCGARKHSHSMHDLVKESVAQMERDYKARRAVTGLPSGLADLDELTAGFQDGELIIVAARPSMGKTAFALQAAAHVALRVGLHVAVFSLEMGGRSLSDRLIANEARIDLAKMRKGIFPPDGWMRLAQATGELGEAPIHIEDPPSLNLSETRSACRRIAQQHGGLGAVVIDYLQLMQGPQSENKATEVGELSKGLKSLARELGVPVIALSQLNRGVEARADKRPLMSDLRESGAIEQDADVIMFLYREDYYLKDKCPEGTRGTAEIIVAKHRNGPTGTARVLFDGATTRFDNQPQNDMRGGYAP